MKILLSGGGTIGSVSPLIAVFEEIKSQRPETEFLWVATKDGPEHRLVASYNIPIQVIAAGKFRRYFSLRNFWDPCLILFGFFQSLRIISKFKPDVILSAGGFVSVPLVWAGWLLGRPAIIHQQDVLPGLANKLMAKAAKIITVTFEKSKSDFSAGKTFLTGNPVRADILTGVKSEANVFFQLTPGLPTVLIMGGSTGATALNKLALDSLSRLVQFCQIIHLTGGRTDRVAEHSRYHSYNFLTSQLKHAYAAADLVVTRAGMSALTELAALNKAVVVIPIPNSHQEYNAIELAKNNAAVMIDERQLTPAGFAEGIKGLLADESRRRNLGRNLGSVILPGAAKRVAEIVLKFSR